MTNLSYLAPLRNELIANVLEGRGTAQTANNGITYTSPAYIFPVRMTFNSQITLLRFI